ncbi:MAG: hypothetical protein E6J75_01735 [Deltaproteobacteria bacterium]|nr:MAG: hypothetical protein E6J75_01735 [Deltaproteobacteria bacterium]
MGIAVVSINDRLVRCGTALLLLWSVARAGEPSPVTVHARAEPSTVTIGARFRYMLEVASAKDAEVFVTQPADRIGDCDIVDFGIDPPVQRDGETILSRWYQLVCWEPGHHLLESPPVQYRTAGEEKQDAPGDALGVTVESLLEKEPGAADIRDIKAPEPIPVDWRPYWLLGGGLLAAVLIAFVLYRTLNRPKRPAAAAPPRPPHVVAAAELDRLRARRLIEQGAFKEYYSELSDVVRRYLESRFKLRAPEMTTEEFLIAAARDGRLAPGHRRLLGEFMTESDLVKFARHLPTIADSERAWTAARRFVDETAAAPQETLRAAG